MSIAWGSLVLVVLLLPGILFFLGLYWPEQFTREAESRSPLGQLAGALLIAFSIHGFAYSALSMQCGDWVPCISAGALLDVINAQPAQTRAVGQMLREFRWWIFAYVSGTSAAGILLGAFYGWLVSTRRIRGFARHRWIYDLSVDGLTYAYVLTNIRHDHRILMYKGFLRAFGLQADGRFSYIVLSDVTRMYLALYPEGSETSAIEKQKVIGASASGGSVVVPTQPARPRKRVKSLFVIEGEDISNAVFDILEADAEALGEDQIRRMIREQAAELQLGDQDLQDILRRL